MANVQILTRGEFHAAIREIEPGVFRAEYSGELNPQDPDARELPDYHLGTSVADVKVRVKQLDYSATKGAIVAFTRALSKQLLHRGIGVNGVALGPIRTPLIPASYPPEKTEKHGTNAPMGRQGQPDEVAPCYIFPASDDASYMSGQILHPNGGTVVNG